MNQTLKGLLPEANLLPAVGNGQALEQSHLTWTSETPTKTSESCCARLLLPHPSWTLQPRLQLNSSRWAAQGHHIACIANTAFLAAAMKKLVSTDIFLVAWKLKDTFLVAWMTMAIVALPPLHNCTIHYKVSNTTAPSFKQHYCCL